MNRFLWWKWDLDTTPTTHGLLIASRIFNLWRRWIAKKVFLKTDPQAYLVGMIISLMWKKWSIRKGARFGWSCDFPSIIGFFNRNTIIEGDEKLPNSELNKAWNHNKSVWYSAEGKGLVVWKCDRETSKSHLKAFLRRWQIIWRCGWMVQWFCLLFESATTCLNQICANSILKDSSYELGPWWRCQTHQVNTGELEGNWMDRF
jgi:hypothetical protein